MTNETEVYNVSTHKDFLKIDRIPEDSGTKVFGPWRVKPGGLSVSRTFGDIEAKVSDLGGIKNVISCEPEIHVIPHSAELDYVLLGCDGIFDTLTNEEVNAIIWETINYYREVKGLNKDSLQDCLGECVNNVLKKSLINQSEDNVTVILVLFRALI
jgi:protein phosphatase 2C family protein 2/3